MSTNNECNQYYIYTVHCTGDIEWVILIMVGYKRKPNHLQNNLLSYDKMVLIQNPFMKFK